MQSSNCQKEGEMMWISNWTWDSAISQCDLWMY